MQWAEEMEYGDQGSTEKILIFALFACKHLLCYHLIVGGGGLYLLLS